MTLRPPARVDELLAVAYARIAELEEELRRARAVAVSLQELAAKPAPKVLTVIGVGITDHGATPDACRLALMLADDRRIDIPAKALADALDSSFWFDVRLLERSTQ